MHDAPRHPQKQQQQRQHAHQAKLFANHGDHEVGVCLGQPVQFLHTATQADAKNFAAPNGDQRMRQLITLGQRVVLAPGVQVGKNARPSVIVEGNHQHKRQHQHHANGNEHADVDAAQKQNAHGDHGDHHKGAHVRLGQQQCAYRPHRNPHRQYGAEEMLFDVHLSTHVVGGVNQHSKFGQLGRLKIHHPQRQPAPRAVDHRADMRHQHQHQQANRHQKQHTRRALPGGHGNLERQQRHDKTNHQRHRMAHQKMGRRDLAKTRILRHGNRRRIHHHQAPGQQCHHHPQQRLVKAQHMRRCGGGAAVLHATDAHR